jgi:cytochrome c oxidase subunit 4
VSEHIVSPKLYFLIFTTLMVLTGTTVYAATVDLNQYYGGLNVIVALVIATCKALLVVLFFMHAYYSSKRTQLIVFAGVFWLAIMLSLTLGDYASRSWDLHEHFESPVSAIRGSHRSQPPRVTLSASSGHASAWCGFVRLFYFARLVMVRKEFRAIVLRRE